MNYKDFNVLKSITRIERELVNETPLLAPAIGLNFDFCIVTDGIENLGNINAIELTKFDVKELKRMLLS